MVAISGAVIASALAAAGMLGSAGMSVGFSGLGARRQYKYAKKLQNKQNEFTERMSNTAHQREVADLQAAGLNPILSATGGSGASTPSSGTGSIIGDDLGDTVSTALDFKRLQNETQLKDSQTALNHSAEQLNHADEWFKRANASLVQEQARNEAERYNNIVAERASILQNIENQTNIAKAQVANLNSGSVLNLANAKFSNERSRGFSESKSTSRGSTGWLHGWIPGMNTAESYSHNW